MWLKGSGCNERLHFNHFSKSSMISLSGLFQTTFPTKVSLRNFLKCNTCVQHRSSERSSPNRPVRLKKADFGETVAKPCSSCRPPERPGIGCLPLPVREKVSVAFGPRSIPSLRTSRWGSFSSFISCHGQSSCSQGASVCRHGAPMEHLPSMRPIQPSASSQARCACCMVSSLRFHRLS